jgi:hypothetical protein
LKGKTMGGGEGDVHVNRDGAALGLEYFKAECTSGVVAVMRPGSDAAEVATAYRRSPSQLHRSGEHIEFIRHYIETCEAGNTSERQKMVQALEDIVNALRAYERVIPSQPPTSPGVLTAHNRAVEALKSFTRIGVEKFLTDVRERRIG